MSALFTDEQAARLIFPLASFAEGAGRFRCPIPCVIRHVDVLCEGEPDAKSGLTVRLRRGTVDIARTTGASAGARLAELIVEPKQTLNCDAGDVLSLASDSKGLPGKVSITVWAAHR